MTEDLAKRLRDYSISHYPTRYGACMEEAADEIERLQQLVEHLSSQLRLQMKANDKAWEAYKEVVGDD